MFGRSRAAHHPPGPKYGEPELRDVHADMMQLTLEIVGKTLLGFDTTREAERVGRALEDAIAYFEACFFSVQGIWMDHVPSPAQVRLQRARRVLEAIVMRMVERSRQDEHANYLLAQLVRAGGEDGERMSDAQACDEGITMLLADMAPYRKDGSFLRISELAWDNESWPVSAGP